MKVYIAGVLFDSNAEPISIVFDNDEQRKKMCNNLYNMPDKDGVRQYCTAPDDTGEEIMNAFMDGAEEKLRRVKAAILSKASNTMQQGILLHERLKTEEVVIVHVPAGHTCEFLT